MICCTAVKEQLPVVERDSPTLLSREMTQLRMLSLLALQSRRLVEQLLKGLRLERDLLAWMVFLGEDFWS